MVINVVHGNTNIFLNAIAMSASISVGPQIQITIIKRQIRRKKKTTTKPNQGTDDTINGLLKI